MRDELLKLPDFFPFWEELPQKHRDGLQSQMAEITYTKGKVLNPYSDNCIGLILVRSGQLRAFVISETGKEVTLYRLLDGDICLFSASCMLNNIQFEIHIEIEKDTEACLLPAHLYNHLSNESPMIANFTNQIMAARFSEVMWTLEQILFKSMDSRIASFLLEQMSIEGSPILPVTHDEAARNLGTAREVVTRMLKYFQAEQLVKLSRGTIELLDIKKLRKLTA